MNEPLDINTFEGWMRKIMERFDRNEQLICSLTGKELKEVHYLDGERLLDNQDVCRMLNISPRTLQTLRDNGTLAYSQINHKTYYHPEDVQRIVSVVEDRRKDAKFKGRTI